MTKVEKLLWTRIRCCRLSGLRFRRQYGVYDYVLDFYCPQYKLAIEIVGDVHGYLTRIKSDQIRTQLLEKLGIRVLSFTNTQIVKEMGGVLTNILSNLPPTPSFIRRER